MHASNQCLCLYNRGFCFKVGLGDKKHGVIGFCWGGKWCMIACADPAFGAGVTAHPAMIDIGMLTDMFFLHYCFCWYARNANIALLLCS